MEPQTDDFIDHRHIDYEGKAMIVYEPSTYISHVLQFCNSEEFTDHRRNLIDITRESPLFVPTHFYFEEGERVYVASEYQDICLADVIDCTRKLTEEHASAILNQVPVFHNSYKMY